MKESGVERLARIPASFIFFIAGILSSVGVNLFTGISGAQFQIVYVSFIVISALLWLLAAAILFTIGGYVESARHSVDTLVRESLSEAERKEIVLKKYGIVYGKIRHRIVVVCIVVTIAVAMCVSASLARGSTEACKSGDAVIEQGHR